MESGLIISREFAVEPAAAHKHFDTGRHDNLLRFPVAETASFAARDALFSAGEAAAAIYQIRDGAVMVFRLLPDGRRQILDIAGPGRFIGLTAGRAHDCTAVALRETSAIRHARHGTTLAQADLQKILFDEVSRLRDLATSLGRKTAVERLAGFLAATMGEDAVDGPVELTLPVSRQELADCLGLVIETVCRNFRVLKRTGVIGVNGNFGVTVRDPEALRRIAAGISTEDRNCDKKVIDSGRCLI